MKRIASILLAVALLFGSSGRARAGNLVVNGGFETGNFNGWTLETGPGVPGDPGFTFVSNDLPHSGTFAAKLGPQNSLGFLSQSLTTVPGGKYDLDFWVQSDGDTPNEFQATFDGNMIFDLKNLPSSPYTEHRFVVTATSASTTLRFGFRNDPGFLHLDDVSVSATPEPASLTLLGIGAVVLLGHTWRRRKAAAVAPAC